MDIQTGLVIGQVITLATVVFNGIMNRRNAQQTRKWAIEDEARSAARHAVTQVKVEESKEAAKEAYHEANSVNNKLEKLGLANNREALARAADALQKEVEKKP